MDKPKPPGTILTPNQRNQKWQRIIDQEDRAVKSLHDSGSNIPQASSRFEFQVKERARGTPFATHEGITDSAFNKHTMDRALRLRLDRSRPQTGNSLSSLQSARTQNTLRSTSSRSTSRTFRSTGQSSLYSLNSSSSNLTQVAMERIEKLERELEEQRRQREEAQKEMALLRKIVEESARKP